LLGVTPESKVNNKTSQQQIIAMYDAGMEIPWDVRKAQPALERAEKEGLIKGVVLDAGCGFGDNAIYLAKKGHRCVGFDFSDRAIEVANKRASEAGVSHLCEFLVADALDAQAGGLRGRRFGTVLDSACLQCFDPTLQVKYIENMASLMAPGGSFVLLVVCNQSQLRSWCRGVRWMQEHLKNLFTSERGWRVGSMEQSTFLENIPMVRITRGVRSFEPVTPSPCIVMSATRPRPLLTPAVCAGAAAAAAAACYVLLLLARRRG